MESRNSMIINKSIPTINKSIPTSLPHDPLLNLDHIDTRRCLAAYTFGNFNLSSHFYRLVEDLSVLLPGHSIYLPNSNNSRLHHTFLQLVTFNQSQHIDTYLSRIDLLKSFISIPRYTVYFHKLILVPTGLLMVGIPSIDLNQYRDRIRLAMSKNNFPIMEGYRNDIVHSTILRFTSPVSSKQLLGLQKLVQHFDVELGTLSVNHLHLSKASWKMAHSELEHEVIHTVLLL